MNALEIKDLVKTYNNGVQAVKGITLSVKQGDFFALLGANGAGKSTTIGVITTLLYKTSGQVIIHGYDLDKNPSEAKACLGLVPQEFNINIFETCKAVLINQAGFYGISRSIAKVRADRLLKQLGLWEKRSDAVRLLSGGMKRRLMIARALVHQPKVLILDEPTAGVDIEIRHSMWDFLTYINKKGTTIILTTHYLEEAEQLCKNIGIIHHGEIVENTTMKELLQSLRHQSFVCDLAHPINFLPDLSPFNGKMIDCSTIEIRVDQQHNLNDVFHKLDAKGLAIKSMRNKSNRLEELFLDLIRT